MLITSISLEKKNGWGLAMTQDIGMLDVSTSMLANQASNYLSTGEVPKRLGNQHPNIVPYQAGHASCIPQYIYILHIYIILFSNMTIINRRGTYL